MEINFTREGNAIILSGCGRLDSNSAALFEERLIKKIELEPVIVLDMSGLNYISSAGLRVLLVAAKKSRSICHKLVLCGLTPEVHTLFDVSGFLALFTIYANTTAALAALG